MTVFYLVLIYSKSVLHCTVVCQIFKARTSCLDTFSHYSVLCKLRLFQIYKSQLALCVRVHEMEKGGEKDSGKKRERKKCCPQPVGEKQQGSQK